MLQHVNTVLIGTGAPESYTTADELKEGQIALFNQDGAIVKNAVDAKAASSLYIGVCEGKKDVYNEKGTKSTKPVIRFSMPIMKGSKPHMVFNKYVAATEDEIVITATDVTPEVGHRYVLRLVYNDIYEAPGQFTHTYEVIAKSTDATDLITAFKNKINKHKEARVVAATSDTAAVLTLNAKEMPYNEGIMLDSNYSQVSVEAFMWKTIPSGLLSNVMYPVANLTITRTQGAPGKGNPKIVRDRENAALGYRGITHRANGIYPYIAPELKADLSATYDTLSIEWDNKYLSDDNQYIKTTPLACELYVNAGSLNDSVFMTALKAFVEVA